MEKNHDGQKIMSKPLRTEYCVFIRVSRYIYIVLYIYVYICAYNIYIYNLLFVILTVHTLGITLLLVLLWLKKQACTCWCIWAVSPVKQIISRKLISSL